jgi:hypothetical protein
METPMNNEPEVTAPTPKEPEVIVDLREWVAQYADPVKLMSLDTDDTMRETRYRTWVDMLAAYDALKAERGAAVRAATAWKRSAKLNKELWNDEKEVHAQRCHDVGTLRARLAACEKIVKAAKRYTDSAPYEVAHYSNDANVAYNVLRTAVATAQGDTI